MAIYIDVIWFLNFSIDLLLLLLTANILKRKVSKLRLIIGAMVASSVIFLVLTPYSFLFYQPLFKIAFSLIIVVTTFGFSRTSVFLQNVLMFYFVSFISGGGLIALHYFFNTEMIVVNGVVSTKSSGLGTPISWLLVVLGFPIMWLLTKGRSKDIEVRKLKYDQIVQVEIAILNLNLSIPGLIDSGNHLHDPITRKPVMVIDMSKLQDRFPDSLVALAKSPETIGHSDNSLEKEWQDRLSIIPYRGVGQKNQFLMGIKPDHVTVITQGGERNICSRIVVGLNFTSLSAEGDFLAIVHPKMMTESAKLLA